MVAVVMIAAVLLCTKRDEFDLLHGGDFSIVQKGSYRGHLLFLGDGREHRETVEYLRGVIEQNFEVLDLISKRFYTMHHLGYKFKYAALDAKAGIMMLRYFARIREHPVFAGYQIQFLFDSRSRRLKSIYTEEVPLE